MTALTEISGDKHVVMRGGRGEVSKVMKAKFSQQFSNILFFSMLSDAIFDNN